MQERECLWNGEGLVEGGWGLEYWFNSRSHRGPVTFTVCSVGVPPIEGDGCSLPISCVQALLSRRLNLCSLAPVQIYYLVNPDHTPVSYITTLILNFKKKTGL